MLSFSGTIVNVWDTLIRGVGIPEQILIELGFIEELRVFGIAIFEFDGNFLVGFRVDSLENFTKGTRTQSSDELKVVVDFVIHHVRVS